MAADIKGVPFKLTAADLGGFGGFDLGEAIKSGFENANLYQEARYKPQNLAAELKAKQLANKINEAKAQYAMEQELANLKYTQAGTGHLGAQTKNLAAETGLIPFRQRLLAAQEAQARQKAEQAQRQEQMYADIRAGRFPGLQNQPSQQSYPGQQQPGPQSQQQQDYISMLRGQEFPQGGAGLFRPPAPQQVPQPMQQLGPSQNDILRSLIYKAWGQKPPPEHVLTGTAREAESMAELKAKYGENSAIYKDAIARDESERRRQQDLSEIRNRQITGLKPGDTPIKNPDTGEIEGYYKQLTPKQQEATKNTSLFNSFYPLIYNGASPFSGSGAALKLEETFRKANNGDKKAKEDAINFMLAEKAITNTSISEGARFSAGKTNQIFNRYAESLQAENIQPTLKKLIKSYGIGPELQREAGQRWQKTLNKAEKDAIRSVPARQAYYFDPEKQYAQELSRQSSGTAAENDPLGIR